jgi:hypothetical protein
MADTPKVPVAVLEYEPSGFEQTLIKHKTKLILVGVLALAGTGGYWGYRLYKEASHRSASVDFVRANSVQDLKAVAEKHSGKPSGGDALVLAAEKLSAERPGEAVDLLKDFLSKYPEHPLRGLASFRMGEYYALSGDNTSAEKEYDAVARANNAFSPLAQLRLGDMKWAAGDTAKAQEYYDSIQKSASTAANAVRGIAKDRIENRLKAKPPVLVDYVPEPVTSTPPAPGLPGHTPGFENINLGNLNGAGETPTPDGALLPPPRGRFDPTQVPVPPSAPPPISPAEGSKPPASATPPAPGVPPASTPAKPAQDTPPPVTPPPGDASKAPVVPPSGDAPKPAPPAPANPPDGKKVP